MVSESEKFLVWKAMKMFGGPFISSLGETIIHADSFNVQKIKETFPEHWEKYLNIGKEMSFNSKMLQV